MSRANRPKLGDGEHRPVPHRCERLVQADAVAAGGAGETTVDVDPVVGHAEHEQLPGLNDHILLIGGAVRVADTGPVHIRQRSG
jgi:hypothetical protein